MTCGTISVDRLPFDPGISGWNAILPPGRSHACAQGNQTCGVLIIGGGFAGLSAARRLKQLDPQLRIVLVEARHIAEGPAGRNSGFMIDLPHHLASHHYAGESDKDSQLIDMNRRAIAFAGDAARDYAMLPGAYAKSGKINAAATAKGAGHNETYAEHLREIGEDFELLDATQMAELCGSAYYRSGLRTPGTALLQPALYVRSFAKGLEKDGVGIFENSPVTGLKRDSNGWIATTPQGSISSGKVIMANNGHVESFGFFKRRLIHIYLFASMTRALDTDEISRLGGEAEWGFTPSDPLGSTVRKVSGMGGTRIIVRNGIRWAPGRNASDNAAEAMQRKHDRSFRARFSNLGEVNMEYRWGGLLCLSMNGASAFGELEPGLFSACCQNGLGSAFGTLSGMAAAELALGQPGEIARFMLAQDQPSKLPPEPFTTIGAKARFAWGEWMAGAEL